MYYVHNSHEFTHTCTHAHMHTPLTHHSLCTHTHTHTHTHTLIHIHFPMHILHIRTTHLCTCTHTHTHTHTHIHTHTHTHSLTHSHTHVMSSVEKLMIVGMKFSRIRMLRMDLQSVVGSPISRQMLSIANFTSRGGWGRERTSTRCCFLIPLTAAHRNQREDR